MREQPKQGEANCLTLHSVKQGWLGTSICRACTPYPVVSEKTFDYWFLPPLRRRKKGKEGGKPSSVSFAYCHHVSATTNFKLSLYMAFRRHSWPPWASTSWLWHIVIRAVCSLLLICIFTLPQALYYVSHQIGAQKSVLINKSTYTYKFAGTWLIHTNLGKITSWCLTFLISEKGSLIVNHLVE